MSWRVSSGCFPRLGRCCECLLRFAYKKRAADGADAGRSATPMSATSLSGWLRLGVATTALWILASAWFAIGDWPAPTVHNWLYSDSSTTDDPLGLFPRIVWSRALVLVACPIALLWAVGAAAAWVRAGFEARWSNPLSAPGRLADVLALVQVLAFGKFAHRSEQNLQTDLQGSPRSADSWTAVAQQHPELFRANAASDTPVSLVARHVAPNDVIGEKQLPPEYASKLLSLVVDLHDRQVKRARAWELFIPVVVALVAGAIGILGALIRP